MLLPEPESERAAPLLEPIAIFGVICLPQRKFILNLTGYWELLSNIFLSSTRQNQIEMENEFSIYWMKSSEIVFVGWTLVLVDGCEYVCLWVFHSMCICAMALAIYITVAHVPPYVMSCSVLLCYVVCGKMSFVGKLKITQIEHNNILPSSMLLIGVWGAATMMTKRKIYEDEIL